MRLDGIRRSVLTLGLCLMVLPGCDDGTDPHDGHDGHDHDGGRRRTSADVEPLFVGKQIEGEGGTLRAEILDFDPVSPSLLFNDWTIRLTKDGEPYTPDRIHVVPWMPDHGHGAAFQPTGEATGEPGEFALERIHFRMGGYWTVTVYACEDDETTAERPCDRENPNALVDYVVLETWIYS